MTQRNSKKTETTLRKEILDGDVWLWAFKWIAITDGRTLFCLENCLFVLKELLKIMQGVKWVIFHHEQRVYIWILYKQHIDASICDTSSLKKDLKISKSRKISGQSHLLPWWLLTPHPSRYGSQVYIADSQKLLFKCNNAKKPHVQCLAHM